MPDDFSQYDAYIDTLGLIAYEDGQHRAKTDTMPPQAEKMDTGSNPYEQRPEFGEHFSQGDFSAGAGQLHYHRPGRDERRVYRVQGFDIEEPGEISHMPATVKFATGQAKNDNVIPFAEAGDKLFRGGTTQVVRIDSNLGASATEDPYAGESITNQIVTDLVSSGDELYAAFGTQTGGVGEAVQSVRGIHKRSSAGTWSHFSAYNALSLGWVKDRLIAADGTTIAEINLSSGAATNLETLPSGWRFYKIFEHGPFVYACAVNKNAGMCEVHHYGLSSAGIMEKKGSTPAPLGDVFYTAAIVSGQIFVAGGRRNAALGYEPIVYQTFPRSSGELDFQLLAHQDEVEGNETANLSVRSMTASRDTLYVGWFSEDVGSSSATRALVLGYDVRRDALAELYLSNPPSSSFPIWGMHIYRAQVLFALNGDTGFYYTDEDIATQEAIITSSIGDWNSAGMKVWDLFQLRLVDDRPANATVSLYYTTGHPKDGPWTLVGSVASGEMEMSEQIEGIESSQISIQVRSSSTDTGSGSLVQSDPAQCAEIHSFTVRSLPMSMPKQWVLTRHFRIAGRDRKDKRSTPVYQNPETMLEDLLKTCHAWVEFREPGLTWSGFVQGIAAEEIVKPMEGLTAGEADERFFVVTIQLVATSADLM